MSDPIITVEGLSKSYFIGHEGPKEGYQSIRDSIVRYGRGFARKAFDMARGRQIIQGDEIEEFWALKDVSFEIKRGEVLGIIGRNGAGKSTLLKILSRITEPTKGRVVLNGRVASLLEVGTGFHPELSGRENVFLNGAILGMSRKEIRNKFEEIVEFSGVEKFLDTPVKRYSSGMYVRLAFAVAAHLEPEILIVDEVLAVGDVEFQKKCLGKMQDVAMGGRTVIFVSHNMGAIQNLTRSCILLKQGRVEYAGGTPEAVAEYSGKHSNVYEASFKARAASPCITGVRLNKEGLDRGDLEVDIDYHSPHPLSPPIPGVVVSTLSGIPVFGTNSRMHKDGFVAKDSSHGTARLNAMNVPLTSGFYRISVWLGDRHNDYDQRRDVLEFEFRGSEVDPLRPQSEVIGSLEWPGKWTNISS